MFEEFSLWCLLVGSSLIWKKEKSAEMVTRCHLLSLVAIRCHSLYHSLYHLLSLVVPLVVPLVVTRCTTRCHRCHLLYHSLSLVVTRCTTRLSFYKWSYMINHISLITYGKSYNVFKMPDDFLSLWLIMHDF